MSDTSHGFDPAPDVPNPVTGRGDAQVRYVAIGQPDPVRQELGLGRNLAIFIVQYRPAANPEYQYVAEMSPLNVPTRMVVPAERYDMPMMAGDVPLPAEVPQECYDTLNIEMAIPEASETQKRWPDAPTAWWFFPVLRTDQGEEEWSQDERKELVPLINPMSHVSIYVVLWRRRVYCAGTSLYLEALWAPVTGETVAMHGLHKNTRAKSMERMCKGLKLLKTIEAHGGRPPDIEDKISFWRFYWDAYQKVLNHKRRHGNQLPTKTAVAAEMLMSTRTLKRYRDRHSLPWPPLPPE